MDTPFIVIVTNPGANNGVINRIKQLSPDHHELTPNVWLVRSPLLVRDFAHAVGLGDDEVGSGVVLRLNGTYWGRSDQNTWDWLSRGR